MGMAEKKIAEQLFESVKKTHATGEHVASEESIFKLFEKNDSVARLFCRGCGSIYELDKKNAERLAVLAGENFTSEENNSDYFESEGCEACDGDDKKVYLRQIVKH